MLVRPMGWGSSVLSSIFVALASCGCKVVDPSRATPSERPDEPNAAATASATPSAGLLSEAPDDDAHSSGATSTDDEPDDTAGSGPSIDTHGISVASHYAGLDRTTCEAELDRRHISYRRADSARGVVAPIRLAGPLSGVTFRSNLPAEKSRTSPYDIYDCRLVLALDDFARVLVKHDIVEVVHLSVYRPVSAKAPLKGGVGRRHSGALAIDAAIFKTKDGRSLSVERDFHGRIGAKPCPAPESASELRKIACEANDARLFNVLLTPNFNWAHRNHFHLEVTAGVRWTLVR